MPGWSRQACPWVLITELPGVSSHTLPCSVGGWMAPRAPCALPSPSHPLPSTCQRDRLPEAPRQVRSFQSLETVHSSRKTMQTSGPCRTGPTSLPDAIHAIRGPPSASLPRGRPSGHACTRPCPEAALGRVAALSEDTLVVHPPSSASTWLLSPQHTLRFVRTRELGPSLSPLSCPLAGRLPRTEPGLAHSPWYPGLGTHDRCANARRNGRKLSLSCQPRILLGGRLEPFSFPKFRKTLAVIWLNDCRQLQD